MQQLLLVKYCSWKMLQRSRPIMIFFLSLYVCFWTEFRFYLNNVKSILPTRLVKLSILHMEMTTSFLACLLQNQGVEINEHSAFTPDITPIILASHKDNYECIKLFLDKKATILHPHDVRCSCKECLQVSSWWSIKQYRFMVRKEVPSWTTRISAFLSLKSKAVSEPFRS